MHIDYSHTHSFMQIQNNNIIYALFFPFIHSQTHTTTYSYTIMPTGFVHLFSHIFPFHTLRIQTMIISVKKRKTKYIQFQIYESWNEFNFVYWNLKWLTYTFNMKAFFYLFYFCLWISANSDELKQKKILFILAFDIVDVVVVVIGFHISSVVVINVVGSIVVCTDVVDTEVDGMLNISHSFPCNISTW